MKKLVLNPIAGLINSQKHPAKPLKDPMASADKRAPWYVYIVCCKDGTLYTGITTDLEGRIEAHNSERGGAKYTRPRRPVELVYAEPAGSRAEAAKREYRIKRMPLTAKLRIVADNRACFVL